MIDPLTGLMHPPAIVQAAFDEQALKREWDEATADIEDAMERKVAILQKALKQWPRILKDGSGATKYAPEMRRFVRDVLGMPDAKDGSMNNYARNLIRLGAKRYRAVISEQQRRIMVPARQIRRAAIELTTKYRLGADPRQCMEALAKFVEEGQRG